MKTLRFYFYLFALCSFNSLFAQEVSGDGRLFPQFEKGTVFLKNGVHASVSLNYDMVQEQMLFLAPDSTEMKIANPLDVAVVKIGERRFLPASSKDIFYEEIPAGEGSFFVQRIAFYLSEGKAAAYGGYSQTSSVTSYGSIQSENEGIVKLKPGDKFRLVTQYVYYLQSGNKYKKFNSAKTLGKLFKGHESEIQAFADRESIDFRTMEAVARIVEYGYSLK